MTRELQDQGLRVGRRRTARLMRGNGLRARRTRRVKRTTDSLHAVPVAPNLINQDFLADHPDETWGADISYLWTREGWLYLAVVLDLFARAASSAGPSATAFTRSWLSMHSGRPSPSDAQKPDGSTTRIVAAKAARSTVRPSSEGMAS